MLRSAGALALVLPCAAWGSTMDLTHQARLLDATGSALNGTFDVDVGLVGDADPALPETVCHTSHFEDVAVEGGFATLHITSVPTSCLAGPLWIATSVGGAEVGRVPLVEVPRAVQSRQVPVTASPSGCDGDGQLVYNTTTDTLLVCDGSAWRGVGSGSSSLGDIRQSLLTESQFQAINGTGWVLMDGRSITGSGLATLTGLTTLPDARGVVLRGKNNGRSTATGNPDGDVAVGTFQADQNGAHSHSVVANPHTGGSGGVDQIAAFNQGYPYNGLGPTSFVVNGVETRVIPYGRLLAQSSGGNETRMRNVTVNVFVRIN
jgi:hypothetical protein